MRLVVISHPEWLHKEAYWVTKLFDEGLQFFHLRKPKASVAELELFLAGLSADYQKRIIIHNHFKLAQKYALGGIHFNEATKGDYNNFNSWQGIRTWACHSLDELKVVPVQVNYVFLSPIFPSISKQAYQKDWNISTLKTVLRNVKQQLNVVALGGISNENVDEACNMGFEGVAVLGAVWEPLVKANDGEACIINYRLLREKCQKKDHL